MSAIAINPEGLSRVSLKHVEDLQKTKFGQTMLSMVELHALSGGLL
jgi:hypothetical protein